MEPGASEEQVNAMLAAWRRMNERFQRWKAERPERERHARIAARKAEEARRRDRVKANRAALDHSIKQPQTPMDFHALQALHSNRMISRGPRKIT